MIHLDNVSYTFKKGGGVTNVNLDINESEFIFMIGPTGSGKTTLLRLIYMDLLPQVGNVVVNKFTSSGMKSKKLPEEVFVPPSTKSFSSISSHFLSLHPAYL